MWIATRMGLYCSAKGSLQLQRPLLVGRNKNLLNEISSVSGDKEYIWVTAGTVIYRINKMNRDVTQYGLPDVINGIDNRNAGIICSYPDKDILWLGTWERGLIAFNKVSSRFQQYFYNDHTRQQNAVIQIAKTGLPGQENILWVSTAGFGFSAFNTETKRFSPFRSGLLNDPRGINGNTYGMYTVPGQGMWIGSQTGLHYYDFTKQIFGSLDISAVSKGEKNLAISAMAFEKGHDGEDEKLWFHIPYKGTYIYNLYTNGLATVPADHPSHTGVEDAFKTFFIDRDNILWVSSGRKGLTAYSLKEQKSLLPDYPSFARDWQWVNCLAEYDDKIWLGTYNGLFLADRKSFTITENKKLNEVLAVSKLSKTIEGLVTDDNGRVWFVTDFSNEPNSCIGNYNPADGTIQFVYKETDNTKTGKPLNEFNDIVFSGGKIFVSDNMNGIWYFTAADKQPVLRLLNQEQGLNNTRVGELIADRKGNIWCINNFGMACYKPGVHTFINYPYYAFGLEVENGSMTLSPRSGKIYSGYTSTIRYVDPDSAAITVPAAIVFNSFHVFNKPLAIGKTLLNSSGTVHLRYRQNTITAEFALPSYSNSFNNLYSWKLEGLEREWNISSGNTASYANLAPGTYTLRVKAANSQGVWSPEKFLVVVIRPPFYKQWWFITACVLVIAGFGYYLFQQRINRVKERYRLRTKIAADLHDDIGSTLTSISILSNVSQQAMDKDPRQAKEMLRQIAAQSKAVQQNMSDIVWAIRPDNDKLEDLLVRMREYAVQTLEPLNIKTSIAIEELLLKKALPLAYRKEVFQNFKKKKKCPFKIPGTL